MTLTSGTIASESGLDGFNKVLISERFCQKFYSATLHSLPSHRDIGVRCDEDDRYLSIRRGKVTLKLKTASPRHSHVEHQASRTIRRFGLQEIGNGRKFLGMQAHGPQQPPNGVA